MAHDRNFQGKRVLVTGGGTGIGKGVALEFAERGAAVALHYSRSDTGARQVVEKIRDAGGKAEAFQADFTDVDRVKNMTREATSFLGGLDVLVNNAGLTTNIPLPEITPEKWSLLFNINVRGMYFVTQVGIESMLEQQSGAIINITSVQAFRALLDHALYAGTKAAIVGFTRTLAIELAPKGIHVNAIAPGTVVVENYYRNFGDDSFEEDVVKSIPIGFAAEPKDIGAIACFLASDEARYIVGQTIVADGGQNACMSMGEGFRQRLGFTWAKDYTPEL